MGNIEHSDEPLSADLRCWHGTDEQPICDDCVRDVLAGAVESRDRLRDQLRGAVEEIERLTRERDELRRMVGIAEDVTKRQGLELDRLRGQLGA